jgi:prevent-host-death family protein
VTWLRCRIAIWDTLFYNFHKLHNNFPELEEAVINRVVSSTDLQKNTREIIDWTRVHGEPVVIETYGKPMAVILSYEDYQRWLQDVAAGKGSVIPETERAKLKRIGELTESLFADADWEEIEAGREDRWF